MSDLLPISGADSEGAPTGLFGLVINAAAEKTGFAPELVAFDNWDDMLEALNAGEIRAAFPWIGDYALAEQYGVIKTGEVTEIPSLLVFRGVYNDEKLKKAAVIKDDPIMRQAVTLYHPDAEILEYDDMDGCLRAVSSGNADFIHDLSYRMNSISQSLSKYSELKLLNGNHSYEVGFALRRNEAELLKVLNKVIVSLDNGSISSAMYTASHMEEPYTFNRFLRENGTLIIFAVTAVLLTLIVMLFARLIHESRSLKALQEANVRNEALNRQLSDALRAAEQANEAKSDFLSRMSHDIRTPMNAIVGFSTLLLQHSHEPEKVEDEAGKVLTSSKHLLGLINAVLDMSRIESGKIQVAPREFALKETINMTESIMRPQFEAKKQSFEITVSDVKHEHFMADDNRIQQVLINILSNAMKYTQEGGTITMKVKGLPAASEDFENISFEVTDNGCGMSEEYQKILFTPFSREELPENKETQGTGLGLAITQNLVNMLGGQISVKSKLGKGSTFTVSIPMEIVKGGASANAAGGSAAGMGEGVAAGGFGKGAGAAGTAGDAGAAGGDAATAGESGAYEDALRGLRLLAAEDNELNAEILTEIFKMNDAEVTVAADGGKVLDSFKDSAVGSFDAILMDIQMPVMNGYEATKAIRALKDDETVSAEKQLEAAGIPIIAMTANAFNEDVQKALLSGMNAHISKPIDIDTIMKTFRKLGIRRNLK
ncbi:MAG: ATP-binding protein [Eubacteriales bacterium]|nr:ATP-binding protein [Eubacteriales bacterium]